MRAQAARRACFFMMPYKYRNYISPVLAGVVHWRHDVSIGMLHHAVRRGVDECALAMSMAPRATLDKRPEVSLATMIDYIMFDEMRQLMKR